MANFIPKKPEKDVISVRISTELLAQLDEKAVAIEISRNELINQCIRFALSNMENENDDNA